MHLLAEQVLDHIVQCYIVGAQLLLDAEADGVSLTVTAAGGGDLGRQGGGSDWAGQGVLDCWFAAAWTPCLTAWLTLSA